MRKIILSALFLSIVLFGCTQQATSPTANTTMENQSAVHASTSVSIKNFAFDPATATVSKGTTITWTNEDSAPHTITGTGFDSGTIAKGGSYNHTFDEAGEFNYGCSIHTSMHGTIIVK